MHAKRLPRGVRSTLNALRQKLTFIGGQRATSCLSTLDTLEALIVNKLSPAEQRVLNHLQIGQTNQSIATTLGVTVDTVKQHCTQIYAKTGVKNRAQLLRRRK